MALRARNAPYPRQLPVRAIHGRARRSLSEAGFTLLEILITIALIALLAGVLIAGSARMLADRPATPVDVFRKAVNECRKLAVEGNQQVTLTFDSKEKIFKSSAPAGGSTFPVNGANDLTIEFLAGQKGGGAMLIAGELVETQTVPKVIFYPDGTCSPFRVQLQEGGNVRVIAIDPWTCAPVLESDKK